MIQTVKTKLAGLLKEKAVSLAMLYNREGEILWYRGRRIKGKTIYDGEGFSRSYIKETLKRRDPIEKENVIISTVDDGLPESAVVLKVKCLVIQPVSDNFYLYIDSGIKDSFSKSDREIFKFIGELLEDMVDTIKKSGADMGGIAGNSQEIKRIRDLVLKYSLEDEPILLLGETGSGKSHIAELIHKYSGRKGKFFIVNTPGIPDTLFESEMFGHCKGAFTDAKNDKKGFVDEAEGGTLFFDEISEVPVSFQAKLLRFIETRKYLVLGESVEREADVRIVAATNKDLHDAIKKKEFREDLYYRLQVLEIKIPPLRERKDDIKALVTELLPLLKGKEVGSGFWEAVYNHNWPGNVRELITVLTRAGILMDSPITGGDVRDILDQSSYRRSFEQSTHKIEQIWDNIRAGKSFWDVVKTPFLERDLNRDEVKEIIKRGLAQSGGKYKNLLELFNLKTNEYKKLMKFLNGNRLNI
jgi:two-component system response regulator PilR (NtrC family)